MKLIVVVEVDEERVLFSHHGSEDLSDFEGTIASAVEGELGWAEGSGISVVEVIEPDHECLEYLDDPDPICVAMNAQKIGSYVTDLLKN
jgi:hypothetical protein